MYIKSQMVLEIFLFWNFLSSYVAGWNYRALKEWGQVCNEGHKQSPVNLKQDVDGLVDERPILQFINADVPLQNVTLVNTGYTIQFSGFGQGETPGVTSPYVLNNEKYNFLKAHLHWSRKDTGGTEHAIEGRKYATELHVVHVNQKYDNVSIALEHEDGLVVLGILYKIDNDHPSDLGIEKFISLARKVKEPKQKFNMDSFCLDWFYSNKITSFYSYVGSLTTSPCTENVRWIVAADPHPISSKLMWKLRRVKFWEGNHNVRPLQKCRTRRIKFFKDIDTN